MQINTTTIKYLKIAAFMMALGISIGAFGAHGLAPYLDEYGTKIYHTGVDYWFYNTTGLFAIAFMTNFLPNSKNLNRGFWLVLIGILIFSVSLFVLALTHIKILGAITPFGGTAMIIGWILVILGLKTK